MATSPLNAVQQTAPMNIPAIYMRGGTSKGVFFRLQDLPTAAQIPGETRDALLLRVIGSPDPYGKQIDGMGGATSSTSKIAIISPSNKTDHDVEYLFGQVAIDKPFIDWSGNCGNLTAAVGAFAIHSGLINPTRIPQHGICTVRIWQANINKTIIAHVPISNSEVQETGDFELDGVTFNSAEIKIDFINPADEGSNQHSSGLFPTGNTIDNLNVPNVGNLKATLINAGIPTIFIKASDLGYDGIEGQAAINNNPEALAAFEAIRTYGAIKMGLSPDIATAASCQHTPKIAFIAEPQTYLASSGKQVLNTDIDLLVRALSMGKLHHAMMGTAAVAIGAAAAIPGTIVHQYANMTKSIQPHLSSESHICIGHPSGTLTVGATALEQQGKWNILQVSMSRSARILMQGFVRIPAIEHLSP